MAANEQKAPHYPGTKDESTLRRLTHAVAIFPGMSTEWLSKNVTWLKHISIFGVDRWLHDLEKRRWVDSKALQDGSLLYYVTELGRKEMQPTEHIIPDWLFIGTFPTCYVYADMRVSDGKDYKDICRVFFNPVRIEVITKETKKYGEPLELAKKMEASLIEKAKNNEPIVVSTSGQTIQPTISR